jgi:AraC-like DNA-binding protein
MRTGEQRAHLHTTGKQIEQQKLPAVRGAPGHRLFRDPDEYFEALNVWGVQARITSIGPFRAALARRNFGSISCISGKTSPMIYGAGGHAGTTSFIFREKGSPSFFRNGVEITENDVFIWSAGADLSCRLDNPCSYHVIAIPDAELGRLFDEPFSVSQRIRPSARSLRNLRRIHHAAMGPAGYEAASFQETLLRAAVECLATAEDGAKIKDNNRTRTILRFQELLESNRDWSLSLDEICGTIGVLERTLRRYCDNYLGMGPHEFMMNHRLNKVRKELTRAEPTNTKVAEVAARYGFNDPSRFARSYRQLFDEVPSVTLRSKI